MSHSSPHICKVLSNIQSSINICIQCPSNFAMHDKVSRPNLSRLQGWKGYQDGQILASRPKVWRGILLSSIMAWRFINGCALHCRIGSGDEPYFKLMPPVYTCTTHNISASQHLGPNASAFPQKQSGTNLTIKQKPSVTLIRKQLL